MADLQKKIDLRTAQDELAAFDKISSPSALELLQKSKLEAEVEYLRAQRALIEAQTAIFASQAAEP